MANTKKATKKALVWMLADLKLSTRSKKARKALILTSGKNYQAVVYRTLDADLEAGAKNFTVKLYDKERQGYVKAATRNTKVLAMRAAQRWMERRVGMGA